MTGYDQWATAAPPYDIQDILADLSGDADTPEELAEMYETRRGLPCMDMLPERYPTEEEFEADRLTLLVLARNVWAEQEVDRG